MTNDTNTTAPVVNTDGYEKGTWQDTLNKSASLFDKSASDRKRASAMLWDGAQTAINEWVPRSDDDAGAEGLSNEVLGILGKSRKGDVSKIKTVALAVKNNGLVLSLYPNLSKAYAEATRLTKTVAQEKAEDEAAEKAVEALAKEAPNTASTPENAAKIVLSKGMDEAARLLLDALGASNEAAHRALMRAISQEIAGRVKPPAPKKASNAPKKGATKAVAGTATKAKPKAASGATKAKPQSVSKGDPNKKALPPKAKPATTKAKPVRRPVARPA